jgi:ectoine hydroxylase-related dioxygenase (phytanoyl-CoA dioxygenase family)
MFEFSFAVLLEWSKKVEVAMHKIWTTWWMGKTFPAKMLQEQHSDRGGHYCGRLLLVSRPGPVSFTGHPSCVAVLFSRDIHSVFPLGPETKENGNVLCIPKCHQQHLPHRLKRSELHFQGMWCVYTPGVLP